LTRYLLDVPNELWKKFKEIVPKNQNLNDTIIKLIEEKLNECKRKDS